MENQITDEFERHSAPFFKDRSEYDTVHVLLLYWKDGDLKIEGELDSLRTLFGQALNFLVASYPIPGDGTQQARLNKEITSFVEESALRPRSLIIIYYAGHCSEKDGKAQWAALEKGGRTLDWSHTQKSLFHAIGDVLLILDCCHATLITRGAKQSGRLEVIAACAKGLITPLPGNKSFTQALLTALSDDVMENGTTAHRLRGMIEDYAEQTPFWDSIGSNAVTSIPIRRLQPPSYPGFMQKPTGYVFFRASLVDDLDGVRISDWLKSNAPPNVSAVNIEAIVLKARRLQKIVDHNVFTKNSIFRRFPESAQVEVLRELQALDTVMTSSRRRAQSTTRWDDKETIANTLNAIEASTKAVNTSIETPILLDLPRQAFNEAINEKEPILAEAIETMSLRDQILRREQGHIQSFKILRNDAKFSNTPDRFRTAKILESAVVLEFFDYEPNKKGDPTPDTIRS